MTRDETKQLLMLIESIYPTFKISPENCSVVTDVWAVILMDQDYSAIQTSLLAYSRNNTSNYAPSPGMLIAIAKDDQEIITTENAVTYVRNAVRNSLYHSREEFDKLPELIKKAVGSPENLRAWAANDLEAFEAVTLSHFRKQYNILTSRYEMQKDYSRLLISQPVERNFISSR